MENISKLVKVSLPNYLSELPIPDSFGGIFHLSVKDWFRLLPFVGTVSFLSWVTYTRFRLPKVRNENGTGHPVNPAIHKDSAKVVQSFDIENLDKQTCFCRCWRSNAFPYCDGSHNAYNAATGDNVGPLIVKKKH